MKDYQFGLTCNFDDRQKCVHDKRLRDSIVTIQDKLDEILLFGIHYFQKVN